MRKRIPAVVAVVALLAVSAACSNDEGSGGSTGAIEVTEKDFAIAASPATAPAGDVTFDVTNDGPSMHEFVVFQTDLDPADLPLTDEGTVDEEGEGLTLVDEIEDIAAGSNETLQVSLDAGSYALICNLPGHYKAGMHTGFTVE